MMRWFSGWIQKLKQRLGNSESSVPHLVATGDFTPLSPAPLNEHLTHVINQSNWPAWIQDQAALRDEGVIYGLTNSSVEEKLLVIEKLFEPRIKSLQNKVAATKEQTKRIDTRLEEKQYALRNDLDKKELLENRTPETEYTLRNALGMVFSLIMLAGNFVLIDYILKNPFPDNHLWVSGGVIFTGFFSLFTAKSLLFESKKMNWQSLIVEILVPIAAALFIFSFAWESFKPMQSLFFLLYMLASFLIVGKLLLSYVSALTQDVNVSKQNRFIQNSKKGHPLFADPKSTQTELDIINLEIEKREQQEGLIQLESQIQQAIAEKDLLQQIFLSEYHLAKNYKSQFPKDQIQHILGR